MVLVSRQVSGGGVRVNGIENRKGEEFARFCWPFDSKKSQAEIDSTGIRTCGIGAVAESIRQGIKAGIKGRLGSSLVKDRGSPLYSDLSQFSRLFGIVSASHVPRCSVSGNPTLCNKWPPRPRVPFISSKSFLPKFPFSPSLPRSLLLPERSARSSYPVLSEQPANSLPRQLFFLPTLFHPPLFIPLFHFSNLFRIFTGATEATRLPHLYAYRVSWIKWPNCRELDLHVEGKKKMNKYRMHEYAFSIEIHVQLNICFVFSCTKNFASLTTMM